MSTKRQKRERSSRGNHQDHKNDDDERKPAARAFLWVKVPIDDQHNAKLSIEVNEGDFIDTIKEAIKKKRSNAFASIDASDIELFESEQDIELKNPPLDAAMEWDPDVTWGTKDTPLFVQVPVYRNSESPRSNSKALEAAITKHFSTSITTLQEKEKLHQSGIKQLPPRFADGRKNIPIESRPVGRPVRVLRPLTCGHELKKVEQHKLWKNGEFVACQTKFAQRQCVTCRRKVRTYCSCNPGQTLCINCFTEHVSQVRDAENGDN